MYHSFTDDLCAAADRRWRMGTLATSSGYCELPYRTACGMRPFGFRWVGENFEIHPTREEGATPAESWTTLKIYKVLPNLMLELVQVHHPDSE